MKLTREELAEIRKHYARRAFDAMTVRKLFDFATEMLPLWEALEELLAAERRLIDERAKFVPRAGGPADQGAAVDRAAEEGMAAYKTLWTLARKLAETDAETEP